VAAERRGEGVLLAIAATASCASPTRRFVSGHPRQHQHAHLQTQRRKRQPFGTECSEERHKEQPRESLVPNPDVWTLKMPIMSHEEDGPYGGLFKSRAECLAKLRTLQKSPAFTYDINGVEVRRPKRMSAFRVARRSSVRQTDRSFFNKVPAACALALAALYLQPPCWRCQYLR
jgi:hypothetical protein